MTDDEQVLALAERAADRVIRHGCDREYLIGTLASIYEDWLVLYRQLYPEGGGDGTTDGETA